MKKPVALLLALAAVSSASAAFYMFSKEEARSPSRASGTVSPLLPLRGVLSAAETSKQSAELMDVVVEVPRDSTIRYRYDARLGAMRYDRRLPSSVRYPGPYGIVPFTKTGRGEPLRAVVLSDQETFPGELLSARPIADFVLGTEEQEEHVILAVPLREPLFETVTELARLPAAMREDVAAAFNAFTDVYLQSLPYLRVDDAAHAQGVIMEARERYAGQRKRLSF